MWGQIAALAAGLGLGAIDNKRNRDIENQQRRLAAETARYSPWTGLNPQQVDIPRSNTFGDLMKGAMTGLSMGQSIGAMGGGNTASSPWASYGLSGIGPVRNSSAYADALNKYKADPNAPGYGG